MNQFTEIKLKTNICLNLEIMKLNWNAWRKLHKKTIIETKWVFKFSQTPHTKHNLNNLKAI